MLLDDHALWRPEIALSNSTQVHHDLLERDGRLQGPEIQCVATLLDRVRGRVEGRSVRDLLRSLVSS